MDWSVVPFGLAELLKWIKDRYNNPAIYITENGAAFNDKLVDGRVNDTDRVKYLDSYIKAMGDAIKDGVNVKGYFVWSLMDNFEWASGYSQRFGLYYVDYKTLERIPKESAKFYKKLMEKFFSQM